MVRKTRRKRLSYRDTFLQAVQDLSGGESKLLTNASVRDKLGWGDDRYKRIKSQLLDEKLLMVGRGYGGTVGLASPTSLKALSLFISYSHADEQIKNELLKHLNLLERLKLIDTWHDRKLKGGDNINHQINESLAQSNIAIFLVSVDFINSSYCYDTEVEKAMELQAEGKLCVIPVIARSCLWQYTPFAKLLALPRDGKAITTWPDKDEAFANVTEGIRLRALELLDNQ